MDSRQLIDAQFDRAVEIVQSLPKNGPIQTGYEEKLTMYSLYKQATIGNVNVSRPGIFDMLGRAKWDAWAKHKDLDPHEAKWLYVDALLKALGKYSDKTLARDLINELQSYGGDTENLVLSHTLTRSRASESSNSTSSDDHASTSRALLYSESQVLRDTTLHSDEDEADHSSEDGEHGDEPRELPYVRDSGQQPRPLSSSSWYRTPITGSLAMSPPPQRASVPAVQPLPNFETPSAFAEPGSVPSTYPPASHTGRHSSPSRDLPPQIRSALPHYKAQTSSRQYSAGGSARPPSRVSLSLEHAVENIQAHLAALTERLDSLESSIATQPQRSTISLPSRGSSGRGSPPAHGVESLEWDVDDMGLWSLALKPVLRGVTSLQQLFFFFLRGEHQSPVLIIIRRLCLDISFTLSVLALLRIAWKKSRSRRTEVNAALVLLWGAVIGRRGRPRITG
ncbi:ACBP-domain-containing protein [Phlebopus sp. FC_14]|nr:ACBP-domain-containing protein [Phlebopus sp. FC_14]